MTAAFDTIQRSKLMEILMNVFDEDELRMTNILLSNTTPEVKMQNVQQTYSFKTNVGAPQGDGLSGPPFELYFEDALRQLRTEMLRINPAKKQQIQENQHDHCYVSSSNISYTPYNTSKKQTECAKIGMNNDHSYSCNALKDIEHDHGYFDESTYGIPEELLYADDADFNTLDAKQKDKLNGCVADILNEYNLMVNNDKTEHVILQRGKWNEEKWRNVLKLGSLLGDAEDIARRKQLTIAAMKKLETVWFSNYSKIGMERRIHLFEAIVITVLTYNSQCWGLRKKDIDELNTFHRRLLRRLCKIN